MANNGWIKLHRKIMDDPLYLSEKFDRTHAWIDLILIANHSYNFFYKRGIKVDVQRGQVGWDLSTLGKRWKWSRGKVERFLNDIENDNKIVRQKNNVTTLISIINYDKYQTNDNANSNPNDNTDGQQTVNQIAKQTETNKNEENLKTEKNEENSLRELPEPPKQELIGINSILEGSLNDFSNKLTKEQISDTVGVFNYTQNDKILRWRAYKDYILSLINPLGHDKEDNTSIEFVFSIVKNLSERMQINDFTPYSVDTIKAIIRECIFCSGEISDERIKKFINEDPNNF